MQKWNRKEAAPAAEKARPPLDPKRILILAMAGAAIILMALGIVTAID